MSVPPCFACGRALDLHARVKITGHLLRGDPTIRLHHGCAVDLAAELLGALRSDQPAALPPIPHVRLNGATDLTPAEVRVLHGIVRGDTNRQIGRRLNRSEKTVKNIVSATLLKLEVGSRTEAATKALLSGIVSPDACNRTEDPV